MTVATRGEMCRLVVHGRDQRIEIAVPAGLVVADLLPALLHHLGDAAADAGLAHGGWVLQRLGGPPLDEDATVEALGLTDGADVYLRPRSEQLPEIHFDDLADGLAAGVADRAGRWRPEMARWASAAVAVLAALAAMPAIAAPGMPGLRAAAAALVAAVSLAAGFVFARSFGDRLFGLTAAMIGIGYAGLAGFIVPGESPGDAGPRLFCAAVLLGAAASLAGVLMGFAGPMVAGVMAAAVCGAAGTALMTFGVTGGPGAAAVVLTLSTVGIVLVPATAVRLARIRIAPLPTRPEHLQEDIDPEPAELVLAQALTADNYMTALHTGLGLAGTAAAVVLGDSPGWAPVTLVGLAAVARLLAVRPMTSGWHRLAVALPALAGLPLSALHLVAALPQRTGLGVAVVAVVVVPLGALTTGRRWDGRRAMPIWGRLADVLQVLVTVALLPVTAAVLGLYGAARAIGG
ncbi:type VII secretion integral membrane protein EccD [Actinoplanes sp. NPDC049596]|uniref:type VII secretion integral membrane protein EccD n=1 Tax=unclassified Actinoplanes TaxID=2626549 RepID=UPI00343EEDB4